MLNQPVTNEQIIKCIRAGEARQLETLIEQNQGLIYRTAKRYIGHAAQNRAIDIDDLYQSAVLGLLEAVPAWDESRGAFTTLAVMHMKNSIRAALGIHTAKQRIENMPTASLDAPIAEGGRYSPYRHTGRRYGHRPGRSGHRGGYVPSGT